MAEVIRVAPERLEAWSVELLIKAGVPADDAREIARHLIFADLRGVDTHGTSRLKIYLTRMEAGLVNRTPDIRILRETPVSALMGGDDGFGQVVARKATDLAIEKAKTTGMAVVGVNRSTHCGCMAYYTLLMAEAGLIGMAGTNAVANMPPFGGKAAFFGTNPYSMAAPVGNGSPFVFDMATSVVAKGKIINAAREGKAIPEGWAIDKDGNPTTDSKKANEGLVLPMAGAKGSALAFMVEILSGVMTGALIGPDLPLMYADKGAPQQVGHFFLAFRPDMFMSMDEFKQRMDETLARVRAVEPAPGFTQVYAPGDVELAKAEANSKAGIPVPPGMQKEFGELAERYGLGLPF